MIFLEFKFLIQNCATVKLLLFGIYLIIALGDSLINNEDLQVQREQQLSNNLPTGIT